MDLPSLDLSQFSPADLTGGVETIASQVQPDQQQPAQHALRKRIADGPPVRSEAEMDRLLFFDFETIPDQTRLQDFDLPPLPAKPVLRAVADCESAAIWLEDKKVGDVFDGLVEYGAPPEWVLSVRDAENERSKPRKGVLDNITKYLKKLDSDEAATDQRIKMLSVTPEYCQIVSAAWARGDGEVESGVVGEEIKGRGKDAPAVPLTEKDLVTLFWSVIETASTLVGYNIASFDLDVLFARSAILSVRPSRRIDTTPWRGDVCDLLHARFGKRMNTSMPLKQLAPLYGVHPAVPTEGSDVYRLWVDMRFDEIRRYNVSDVEVVRGLWKKWDGMWV